MWSVVIEYKLDGDKRLILASKDVGGIYNKMYQVGISDGKKFLTEFAYTSNYDRAIDVYKKELKRHKEIYNLSK